MQIVNILHSKEVCKVGYWKVRTLYETGKFYQVLKRLTGSGARKLATGHHILYPGRNVWKHSSGVVLILNRKLKKCIIGWKPFSDKLPFEICQTDYYSLLLTNEDKGEEDKDSF